MAKQVTWTIGAKLWRSRGRIKASPTFSWAEREWLLLLSPTQGNFRASADVQVHLKCNALDPPALPVEITLRVNDTQQAQRWHFAQRAVSTSEPIAVPRETLTLTLELTLAQPLPPGRVQRS
ncbi:MAG: hypothetical protein EBZ51_12465 [Synechococcaceae bacterium WB9_2_112]|nr:hypothetical protein [Synechococcaceae bacterium WB9_2_112]